MVYFDYPTPSFLTVVIILQLVPQASQSSPYAAITLRMDVVHFFLEGDQIWPTTRLRRYTVHASADRHTSQARCCL